MLLSEASGLDLKVGTSHFRNADIGLDMQAYHPLPGRHGALEPIRKLGLEQGKRRLCQSVMHVIVSLEA